MRILLVGAGGVGGAITTIAARRRFPEAVVVADFDPDRAEKAVASVGDHDGLWEPAAGGDGGDRTTDSAGTDEQDAHGVPSTRVAVTLGDGIRGCTHS